MPVAAARPDLYGSQRAGGTRSNAVRIKKTIIKGQIGMSTKENRQVAHEEIDYIFQDLLPGRGLPPRPEQIALSHRMLDAMLDGQIALCDAGTGIGKTLAYLVAGVAVSHHLPGMGPIIISTSSIALQQAVQKEYLPLLSEALLEAGMLWSPLEAVVRKGKAHYVCDRRLEQRLKQVNLEQKNPQAAAALLSLRERLDLDEAEHLSGYDRERVHVPPRCDCDRHQCRYLCFLELCNSGRYLFQICNHNLLLANALHREAGKPAILPEHRILIIDEAHMLPDSAAQMLGITITEEALKELVCQLKKERYVLAAERLEEYTHRLLSALEKEEYSLKDCYPQISQAGHLLHVIKKQLAGRLSPPARQQLDRLVSNADVFITDEPELLRYAEEDRQGGSQLCAVPADLSARLRAILWRPGLAAVLTSGTLAVGTDFSRFKAQIGLLGSPRVIESVSPSPYDYQHHCLLYLPRYPPKLSDDCYCDVLAADLIDLITAAHGHALVLFTSYATLAAVRERLRGRLPFPLFTMGRGRRHTAELFKASPGGVLLAAGPAWEGMDFPGDCVSLLVIPRLPFPRPDARREAEREQYDSLRQFLRAIVIPEMQMKLRQGFGRAIRTEMDTCVIAILDERAAEGRRYHRAMRNALPEMPVTHSLKRVERFLRSVKPDSYFREASA